MIMYCHNYDCDVDNVNVTVLARETYAIDFAIVASERPICLNCGDDLSSEPIKLPDAYTKVTYPNVRGLGSSRGG